MKDEMENGKSSDLEESVWEKVSSLWNDSQFEPETVILSGLHPYESLSPETLRFDKVES
jgi:hypothetical protein